MPRQKTPVAGTDTPKTVNSSAEGAGTPQDAPEMRRAANYPTASSDALRGVYRVCTPLSLRNKAGTDARAGCTLLAQLPQGQEVRCEGGYAMAEGMRWLYIKTEFDGVTHAGYCTSRFLSRE